MAIIIIILAIFTTFFIYELGRIDQENHEYIDRRNFTEGEFVNW